MPLNYQPPFTFTHWCELADRGQRWDISIDEVVCNHSLAVEGHYRTPRIVGMYEDVLDFAMPSVSVQVISLKNARLRRNVPPTFPGVGAPGPNSNFHARVKHAAIPFGAGTALAGLNDPPHSRFELYQFDLTYTTEPYEFKTDGELLGGAYDVPDPGHPDEPYKYYKEWERYCVYGVQPHAELLTLEGGQMQFVENLTAGAPPRIRGSEFPINYATVEQKATITILWKNVPADFVLNDARIPVQFLEAQGCVNSDDFLDYEAETLLFIDDPEFIAKPLGFRPMGWEPTFNWQYDILIKFRYFDPPRGKLGGDHRGHNVFAPTGQKYYLYANRVPWNVTPLPANFNAANPPMWTGFDFHKLFQWHGYE